jgi:uncharacterized protein YjbI with pentapeptide repeats
MADEEQLAILRQGPEAWNAWRQAHPEIELDLSGANLRRTDLRKAKLWRADLSRADLRRADLRRADLSGANLRDAKLVGANLRRAGVAMADLSGANLIRAKLPRADLGQARLLMARLGKTELWRADLSMTYLLGANLLGAKLVGVDLSGADLRGADLSGADLRGANLTGAGLIGTRFAGANLTGCRVYGISAWDLHLEGATEADLIITQDDQPEITVDNLEVAQFIYLLLNNERIRHVIDTITSKVALILGRFTPERKAVLDGLRDELRKRDYLPVLFDFDKPAGKDLTGTVQTLANMARFIIADLTDPNSVPHELAMVVPVTVVPVQPVLLGGKSEYPMFVDLKQRYHWVLEPYHYNSPERLMADLGERVIGPAEAKALTLRPVARPGAS